VTVVRSIALRTTLVWILLELVAALQVKTANGSPMLFAWIRTVVEPAIVTAERTADLVVDLGLGIRGLQELIVDNRRMRLQLEELQAREMLLQTDLDALRQIGNFGGVSGELEAGALIGRCSYRDLAGGEMEVRTAEPVHLRRDTPVVAAQGLVGRIIRSEGQRHWLQLLTHAAAAVAVQTEDGLVHGLALGTGSDALTVAYVPRQAVLERGDLLVTSGADSIYPPGIPTVRVIRVRESDEPFLEVTAVSTADHGMTRMVLILPEWAPSENGGVP
jgi:rod shape-determining protein MreC